MIGDWEPTEGELIEVVGHPALEAGSIRKINKTLAGDLFIFCNEGKIFINGEFTEHANLGYITVTKC